MKTNMLTIAIAAGLGRSMRADSNNSIEELQDKLLRLTEAATNYQARADGENRQLTTEERKEIDSIGAQFEDTEQEIARRQSIENMRARVNGSGGGRKTTEELPVANKGAGAPAGEPARPPGLSVGPSARIEPGAEDRGKWGFRSYGEFLSTVRVSSRQNAVADPRLTKNAATTYGSEGIGEDGGFAVPPDFRAEIIKKVMGEESLIGFTDNQTSSSNSITFPADETTPWQESGGIQAYWESEAGTKQQSKPNLTEKTVKLNKLICLVPLTDELLQDAPAMARYVQSKAPEKMAFKVSNAIINGSGVGQPLGILNSAGTISVPAESGQTADTVIFDNILALYNRLTPAARRNARWLMNPDVETQLQKMVFPGASPSQPVYLPPGGLSVAPYGTLMGRPIIPHEAMPALGDAGDIVFGDLNAYLSVSKSGGIRSDVSIHVFFDQDVTAFRFVLRIGGQPWWNSAITAYQAGSNTRGFFAKLAERA
jgi:HK97 family phage major capsid protein